MKKDEIGNATIYCGDCLEILPEIGPGEADFVFTDPPYGHNNNNGDLIAQREAALGKKAVPESEWRPIANDGAEAGDLFRATLAEFRRILYPGCCCCCCCSGGGPDPQFARWSMWLDEVFDFKQMVVWDKGPMGMGWQYRRSYETVLVGQVPGAACRWFADAPNKENVIRPGQWGIKKIIPAADQHPTEKPPELAAWFISLHSRAGDVVLDPFMGCGSTGVAAIRGRRKFIGIELDEKFYDAARRKIDAAARQEVMEF